MTLLKTGLAAVAAVGIVAAWPISGAENQPMSFFITSQGSGDGANLGGLKGADAICQKLAQAAGAGNKTWAAYLSTQGADAVNARDRIGTGPWYNAKGVLIARNVAELHQSNVNINHETALTEKGEQIGFVKVGADGKPLPREQQSNVQHDILTGSQADGTAFAGAEDRTCRNWTSNGEGNAMVGHHDRRGGPLPGTPPWNAVHPSQGCGQQNLVNTGGAGLLYCFAK
jgi:hypothetical protein